ncbi:hypothetical protein CEXT_93441 [Caerostris extrusa]|uniref:Uncharacterized protein n=1 Tax=Caerostris extrusa TaxID=172846 RepID=A0AAV4U259_CAEEX|nr:hypothetical protein CEXT_93441 [Caerostris extrusa]
MEKKTMKKKLLQKSWSQATADVILESAIYHSGKANDTVTGVTAGRRDLIKVGFFGAIKLAPALSKPFPNRLPLNEEK